MSKIDELIERLCPDGAEFLTLQECTQKVKNIKWKSYSGNDKKYIDLSSVDRDLHCIMETQNINSDSAPSRAQQIVQTDDILLGTTRPMLKRYCMIPEKYDNEICSTGFCVLRANTEIVLPRWIYHNISTTDFFAYVEQNQKGASYPAISDASVKAFSFPVPPLEVQREIVHILDSFTLLTAELTAELTARKKQYEFYRDKLLSFGTNVKMEPLGNVCDLQAGKAIKANLISDEKTSMASIPCYGANGLRGYVNDYNQEGNKSIIGRQGALCGNVCYATGKYYATEHAVVVTDKGYFNSRYLFHALIHADLNQYKTAGAQPGLSVSRLNDVKIAVPNKDVQDRIADVLDNFEKICTDLNIGLPAEIEARQKQYEYYRDLLLTFAETGNMLATDRQTDRQS